MNNWISLSQTAGTGNAVITVSPDANPSAITRSATIKVSNGSITKTVYVSQRAAELKVDRIEIVGHDYYAIPYVGGTATTSNYRFNVRAYYNDGTSIDMVPATITGDTVTASTTMNISDTPETAGTIHAIATFSGKSATTNVTVLQQPVPETNRIAYTASTPIVFTNDAINNFETNIIASGYSNGSGVYIFDNQVARFYGNASCMITPATKGALTEITVPSSIVNLGQSVFNGCSALTTVNGLENTENVYLPPENAGNDAFRNCTSLTHCGLPHSYQYWSGGAIKADVFNGCSSLTTIIYNGTESEWNAISKNSNWRRNSAVRYVQCTDGTIDLDQSTDNVIKYYAPAKLPEVTGKTWSDYDTGLNINGFTPALASSGHTFENGVGTLTFPSAVTKIGNYTFAGCSGMTDVLIPDNVSDMNAVAIFHNCTSLQSFVAPSQAVMGPYNSGMFQGCSSLSAVTLPSGLTSIGGYMFQGCSALTSIDLPVSVTSIGDYAFDGCTGLTSVNIHSAITSIGMSALRNCKSLTSITIPDSVTTIGSNSFGYCYDLITATLPSGLTIIDSSTFTSCRALVDVYLPTELTEIKTRAFYINAYGRQTAFNLHYPKTMSDWNNITLASDWIYSSHS